MNDLDAATFTDLRNMLSNAKAKKDGKAPKWSNNDRAKLGSYRLLEPASSRS